jgi:hypothetical protein
MPSDAVGEQEKGRNFFWAKGLKPLGGIPHLRLAGEFAQADNTE